MLAMTFVDWLPTGVFSLRFLMLELGLITLEVLRLRLD